MPTVATIRRASMKVTIEKNELVIRIPMQDPKQSASGKTMVVASSHGNQKTGCTIPNGMGKGREIVIGLNAYYKPE